MNKTKNNMFSVVILCILIACIGITLVFCYANQSILRLYPTKITAANILFRYNELSYLDEIGSEDLEIFKGEPLDVTASLKVTGSVKIMAEYKVNFELTENSEITEAIEVYRWDGSRYVFLSMLNNIDTVEITGFMLTNHEHDMDLRFVLSPTASTYYDAMANNSAGKFKLLAKAEAQVILKSDDYVFVSTYEDFLDAFTSDEIITIVLAKDITVSEPLSSTVKKGIELNGFTLTLNETISVNCNYDLTKRLGIVNSGITGGITAVGHHIKIRNLANCYFIDDSIQNSIDNTTIRIETASYDTEGILSDLAEVIRERTGKLTDGTLYTTDGDVSFLIDNIKSYFPAFTLLSSQDSAISYDIVTKKLSVDVADNELTTKFLFAFFVSLNADTHTVSGSVTVRGNSTKAIADHLLSEIPDTLTASRFLRGYDATTGSYIDWYVDDGLSGYLFDNNGRYKKNGLDGIIHNLINFNDKEINIILKVTKGAETGNEVNNTTYYSYRKYAETVDAAERTALVYDALPIVVSVDNNYDICANNLINTYDGVSGIIGKVNLTALTVEIVEDEQEYLAKTVSTKGTAFDALTIDDEYLIPQNTYYSVILSITFTYTTSTGVKTYSVTKSAIVSGEFAVITKYDMQYRLQSALNDNAYINGNGYWFYAYGALLPRTKGVPVPVLVDYEVLGDPANYVAVTYQYVLTPFNELESQMAYFLYDSANNKYILADTSVDADPSLEYYERKVNIEVLPDKLSTTENVTAYIKATLYTLDEDGNPHLDDEGNKIYIDPNTGEPYTDPITGENALLTYILSLEIEGILHNIDSEIADINLYYVYRQIFDANDDGIITVNESLDWAGAISRNRGGYISTYSSAYSGVIRYINLNGIAISTFKGIEYFRNVQGYNFTNTGIKDISLLSGLSYIVYLNFTTTTSYINVVTNLEPLAYLDNLEYLDLSYNKVINLEPLRYLPRLTYLNLSYNSVTNFDPLTETTTLKTLVLTGMNATSGATFITDTKNMYEFSLIKVNCPSIVFTYSPAINITAEMQVAAKVMRDLETINRVKNVLYLPKYYYYQSGTSTVSMFQLYWYVDPSEANLTLIDSYDKPYVGYTINSPIFDKPVKIYLKVFTALETDGSEAYTISREFNLILETSYTEGVYIYDSSIGKYRNAIEAIPDVNLRELIFKTFNFYKNGNVNSANNNIITINVDGVDIVINEQYVISQFDLADINKPTIYNWSNQNINDFTGIECLYSIFNNTITLYLTGNEAQDLSPLSKLSGLLGLYLGGSTYDYFTLYSLNNNFDLKNLYVYECYDLDSEETLKDLYDLYCYNKTVNIYISAGTVWNPYTVLLPKAVSNLPTTASFVFGGDTFDLYDVAGNGTNVDGFSIVLYGYTYKFYITGSTIYSKFYTGTTFFTISTTQNNAGGVISYGPSAALTTGLMFAGADTSYAQLTIASSVTASQPGRNGITFNDYYVQLIVEDAASRIYVHDTASRDIFGENGTPINEVIGSLDLLAATISNLFYYFKLNTNIYTTGAARVCDRIIPKTSVDASSIYDCLVFDSRYKVNYSGGRDLRIWFYYDQEAGIYHITTDMFSYNGGGSTTTTNVAWYGNFSAMGRTAGSFTFSQSGSTLQNYGSYNTGSALKGLKYFTGIYTMTLHRDGSLGDGSELINIRSLTINNSVIDFTHITTPLDNLTTISITTFYAFKASIEAFSYLKNLTSLTLTTAAYSITDNSIYMSYLYDYSFLLGLIDDEGKARLTTFSTYYYTTNSPVSSVNAGYVGQVYSATLKNTPTATMTYRIGSPSSLSDSYYFRVITVDIKDEEGNTIGTKQELWYCTVNNDLEASRSLTWSSADVSQELSVTDATNYSNVIAQMRDFGLKVNNTFWCNLAAANKYSMNIGATVYLPKNTGIAFYGLVFGDGNAMTRSYGITWVRTGAVTSYFVGTDGIPVALAMGDLDSTTDPNYYIYNATSNGYLVLIGTTVPPTGGTARTFIYHFIVGSGDGYYSRVTDITLRIWLSALEKNAAGVNNLTSISITGDSSYYGYYYAVSSSTILANMGGSNALYDYSASYWNKNFIYDLTGIDLIFEKWGRLLNITSITITGQKFSDISPLYAFKNLETLNLSGTNSSYVDHYSYAKLTGIDENGGQLLKLKTLNLNYNASIDPDDILLLSKHTRPLTILSLYHTRCMNNYSVINSFKLIAENNSSADQSISIALNSSATATKITNSAIDNFLTDTNPLKAYPNGFDTDSVLYSTGTQTQGINGRSYTFTMSTYVNRMIRWYDVQNNMKVKLQISGTSSIAQFSGCSITVDFKRSGVTSPMKFGVNRLEIDSFDTEFIAYLLCPSTTQSTTNLNIKTSNPVGQDYYTLISNVTISVTGTLIESTRNGDQLKTAAGANTVSISQALTTSNISYFSLAYKEFSYKRTQSFTYPNAVPAAPTANMLYHGYIAASYVYEASRQHTYTALLPTAFYYLGNLYDIDWSTVITTATLTDTNNDVSVPKKITKSIVSEASNGEIYELSKDTIDVKTAGVSGTVTVTGRFTIPSLSATQTALSLVTTVNKYEDPPIIEYNFYVEVEVEDGNVFMRKNTGEIYYSLGQVPYETLYLYQGVYYSSAVAGADEVTVVFADQIFESQRLVVYLYAKHVAHYSDNRYKVFSSNVNGVQNGYIMERSFINSLSVLEFYYGTNTASNYQFYYNSSGYDHDITSIEGVQIFYNVTVFNAYHGLFIDISPLSNLALTEFYYANSRILVYTLGNYGNNYIINDFSPLFKGSLNTLVSFGYNVFGTVHVTDLSFLMSFPNLKEVYYCSYYSSTTTYGLSSSYIYGLNYFKTGAGIYLLNALYRRGTYIYVNTTMATNFGLKYDTTKGKTLKGRYYTSYVLATVYALMPQADDVLAYEKLSNFISDNPGVIFSDDHYLKVNSFTSINSYAEFWLTSTLTHNGAMFLIDWTKASSNIEFLGYYLEKNITIAGQEYFAGNITAEQAKTIIESIEYFQAYKSGQNKIRSRISVFTGGVDMATSSRSEVTARLIARIHANGYCYERMLTVGF